MRIISGTLRRRKLLFPVENKRIRPTKDRTREAIFNVLQSKKFLIVADLFCGTGSFGLEALSRYHCCVNFVDTDIHYVRKNVNGLLGKEENLLSKVRLIRADVITLLSRTSLIFDLIFMDPPWDNKRVFGEVLSIINNRKLLKKGGIICIEHAGDLSVFGCDFFVKKVIRSGRSSVSFLSGEEGVVKF